MVAATFDPTARFEKALVRLIQCFNYLDTNVGLCIAHLSEPTEPTKAYSALSNMTAEKRIGRLKELLEASDIDITPNVRRELSVWYENAAHVRSIRNRYVHGNWEFLPLRHEQPVGVSAPPWMKDQLGPLANETMSLEQLEITANEVEAAFKEFMRLRKQLGV